jgi:monoamine oxidase
MLVKLVGPDGAEEKSYSHVITTATTPCLQTMDLRGAELNYAQREAIRVLRYDNSVKLGIKFKRKWWIANGITKGGLGKTDRPTRVVVYPSYALGDPVEGEGVLLACYNWSVDAARIGSLSRGSDPTKQERILDVIIQDLAIMHNLDPVDLHSWVDSYHFHDWYRDEFTTGAFGMFGPGQFATLFSYLQMPAAGGNLFFVGELTSIYHGWIVAALNSAYRGVHQMLVKEGEEELRLQLEKEWGIDPEYEPNPEGPTGWQVFLGSLGPEYDDI